MHKRSQTNFSIAGIIPSTDRSPVFLIGLDLVGGHSCSSCFSSSLHLRLLLLRRLLLKQLSELLLATMAPKKPARKSAVEDGKRNRKPAVTALLALLTSLCVASHCLTRDEDREVIRLAVAIATYFELLLRDFVAGHVTDPILVQFQADGTPVAYRRRHCFRWLGKAYRREGDGKSEFMLQRMFVSTLSLKSATFNKNVWPQGVNLGLG